MVDRLPYPMIGKPAKDFLLGEDLYVEQWIVPKGTIVKTYQTKNFGWLILPENALDKRGFKIPKRVFKD